MITRKFKTKRYKYFKRIDDNENPFIEMDPKKQGRHYTFKRYDFITKYEDTQDANDKDQESPKQPANVNNELFDAREMSNSDNYNRNKFVQMEVENL